MLQRSTTNMEIPDKQQYNEFIWIKSSWEINIHIQITSANIYGINELHRPLQRICLPNLSFNEFSIRSIQKKS